MLLCSNRSSSHTQKTAPKCLINRPSFYSVILLHPTHHYVTQLHKLCLAASLPYQNLFWHSCSVVVWGAGSGVFELTSHSQLGIQVGRASKRQGEHKAEALDS